MRGYAFEFIAILHAITVIFTLLYLPFGKFFHIFQRPAQLGASFYKDEGERGERANCRRCGAEYSSLLHIEDLIQVEKKLGYDYEVPGEIGHYQWICPACRRMGLALAQGALWTGPHGDEVLGEATIVMPRLGNPHIGAGPLGSECDTHKGHSMIHLEFVNRAYSTQTVPVVCMHCDSPTCAEVCPADAIKKVATAWCKPRASRAALRAITAFWRARSACRR